jgi:heterodisulfide reductase subunit C
MSRAEPSPLSQENIVTKLRGRQLLNCFLCIKCTSGCTVQKLLELKPHEIEKLVSFGFVDELVSSDIIWTCATCLKCIQRCPQRASPYHVIIALRNLAVEREARVPESYMKAVSQILESGLAESIQNVTNKRMEVCDREGLGLPKIKPPKESFQAVFMKTLEEKKF